MNKPFYFCLLFFYTFCSQGQTLLWERALDTVVYTSVSDYLLLPDSSGVIVAGKDYSENQSSIYRIDSSGKVLWCLVDWRLKQDPPGIATERLLQSRFFSGFYGIGKGRHKKRSFPIPTVLCKYDYDGHILSSFILPFKLNMYQCWDFVHMLEWDSNTVAVIYNSNYYLIDLLQEKVLQTVPQRFTVWGNNIHRLDDSTALVAIGYRNYKLHKNGSFIDSLDWPQGTSWNYRSCLFEDTLIMSTGKWIYRFNRNLQLIDSVKPLDDSINIELVQADREHIWIYSFGVPNAQFQITCCSRNFKLQRQYALRDRAWRNDYSRLHDFFDCPLDRNNGPLLIENEQYFYFPVASEMLRGGVQRYAFESHQNPLKIPQAKLVAFWFSGTYVKEAGGIRLPYKALILNNGEAVIQKMVDSDGLIWDGLNFLPNNTMQVSGSNLFSHGSDTIWVCSHQIVYVNNMINWHDSMACQKYSVLSVPEFKEDLSRVYPNPVSRQIYVETQLDLETIRIMDMKGRLVFETKPDKERKWNMDLSALPPGLYFMELYTREGVTHHKFVKD